VSKNPNDPLFDPKNQTPPPGNVDPNKKIMQSQDANKKTNTAVLDETIDKDNPNPADPYQNFQGVGTTKDRVNEQVGQAATGAKVYEVNRDYAEENKIRQENMRAKETEIAAPGHFTQDEANRIMQGLDPAKQAEVQAQVVDYTTENLDKKNERLDKLNVLISELVADNSLGRNETRAQLRNLRQQIMEIEVRMDKGL
jgi:hypothetical protein